MRSTLNIIEILFLGNGNISISQMIKHFGADSFLVLIFLLISPNLIPFFSQFGIAEFTSGMVCLLALQMMAGKEMPWLPSKIADKEVSCSKISVVGNRIFPLLYKLDLLTQPRLSALSNDKLYRFYGFMIFVLAFLILLPLPFFNYAPAVVITLSIVGLLSRDGLFLLMAVSLFTLILAAFGYTIGNLIF